MARLLKEVSAQQKPLAAICIAPALVAKAMGQENIAAELTIGNDAGTAQAIEAMGGQHKDCPVTDCVVDKKHKIVSTPAYMLAGRISEAATGIEKTVAELLKLI